MHNRLVTIVIVKILFSHVSPVLVVVDKDMVPGLIFGWAAPRHLFVPLVGSMELGVDIDHNTAIAEQPVAHDLPDVELSVGFHRFNPGGERTNRVCYRETR